MKLAKGLAVIFSTAAVAIGGIYGLADFTHRERARFKLERQFDDVKISHMKMFNRVCTDEKAGFRVSSEIAFKGKKPNGEVSGRICQDRHGKKTAYVMGK